MADAYPSAALRSMQAHPMARPGYGKRVAPDQARRHKDDFTHLPPREASIATFIDRLPEGAAMDAKTLAARHPGYGQAACLTALRHLSEAGHLRRGREHLKGDDGGSRWVTRTFFSRTPRDDAWWDAVEAAGLLGTTTAAGQAGAPQETRTDPQEPEPDFAPEPAPEFAPEPDPDPEPDPEPVPERDPEPVPERDPEPALERDPEPSPEPGPEPAPDPEPSPEPAPAPRPAPRPGQPAPLRSLAHRALVAVGRADPRMTLSAADCADLAPLAEPWLERGATEADIVRAVTSGPPPEVHHAAGFARRRLITKLPPEEQKPERRPLVLLECTVCRAPGPPAALPGGLCKTCRGETPRPDPCRPSADTVHAKVEHLRGLHRRSERNAHT
ncbi:hypothetical protein [Streptomyces sp. I05A-00742]|uniref:hypothetical protein n=1 Tax=Streptomyces sp. I05A-00742 TaxID=2732853 RepID=UPI0014894B5F|nr:hypothetical protein [Streptomyces sp. I05A-00742]